MINYQYAYCLNNGDGKNYDAFDSNLINLGFCLSDGANSADLSGMAAKVTAERLVGQQYKSQNDVLAEYESIHAHLNERFPGAACTSAHIQIEPGKLIISYCGDTLIEIFKLSPPLFKVLGQFKWEKLWESTPDWIENTKSPSQLLGSHAYRCANFKTIEHDGVILAMISTDGLHQFVGNDDRLAQIMPIKNHQPSEFDLEYICQTLSSQASRNGSEDDISIAAIWVDLSTGSIRE